MSDMGWSRYISAQEAAADQEMAADEKVAKLIADEGVRGALDRIKDELGTGIGWVYDLERLPILFWAAAGAYCIRHTDPNRWHPTVTGGLCSKDETCPTCKSEPRPAPGFGCVACSYYEIVPPIILLNDPISHTHTERVPGCFRCDLAADEAADPS